MKKFLITTIIALMASISAMAQDDLNIGKAFGGKYHDNENATESIIQNKDYLLNKGITLIRTLKIQNKLSEADFIEPLVLADGAKAIEKTVSFKKGKLYYGFYKLKSIKKNINRYTIYVNKEPVGGNNINLIYIEGKADMNSINTFINSK